MVVIALSRWAEQVVGVRECCTGGLDPVRVVDHLV